MTIKTFVFDLDETLLSAKCNVVDGHLNQTEKEESTYDPYEGGRIRGYVGTYVLQKGKMKAIMEGILANGDEIAFVTSGDITKEQIKKFFQSEYSIDLGSHFWHSNFIQNKTPVLKQIAGNRPYSDVVFVDNSSRHIDPARKAGFTTVYADNNAHDPTNGTGYTQQLENIVASVRDRIRARASAIKSLKEIGIKSSVLDGNFKLQDAVNNIAATGEFSREDWEKIKDDPLLQDAVNNIAATGEFSHGDWEKITDESSTKARNQFQIKIDALKTLDVNKSNKRQQAIDVYASKTFTSFSENVLGRIDSDDFKAALHSTQKECTKTLDDSLSRTLLKGITNFLSHVSVVGIIGNAVHKYKTGNWLFYEHTSERQQMKEASQSLVMGE